MRILSTSEVASVVNGICLDATLDVGPDVVIDSRCVTPGALFVALGGERVDGHDFVESAAQAGAAAALVTHRVPGIASIVVEDVLAALGKLAGYLVADATAAGMTTLALTGSSGKTSVKDLLAHVLRSVAETVAPVGNHNNEIGVPLTACSVTPETRFFVSELGARAVGDIKALTNLIRPQLAAILNIGTAHLGEFGGRFMIAQAKGEIIEDLPATGWAILNADDPYVVSCATRTQANVCWFTTAADAPGEHYVTARNLVSDELDRYSFDLVFHVRDEAVEPVRLQVLGRHQVSNALAVAALAHCAGLSASDVATALSTAKVESRWRLELGHTSAGTMVINDSYNANPESMRVGLDAVAVIGERRKLKYPGARSIAILGTMGELGETSSAEHHNLGQYARTKVDELIAVGEYAPQLCAGFGEQSRQLEVDQVGELRFGAHDLVFVKASRSVGLEKLADAWGVGR